MNNATSLPSYQPSGKIGSRALVLSFFVGVPLSVALGYALAWAQAHATGFIASTFCVLVAVVVVTVCYSLLVGPMRSRNVFASTVAAIVWLACLLGVRWWLTFRTQEGSVLWDTPWAPHSHATGLSLILGAAAEALIIGFVTVFVVRKEATKPFSETFQQAATTRLKGELWARGATVQQVREGLQAHGTDYLLSSPRADQFAATPIASTWRTIRVQADWVEPDTQARWLTIGVCTHERNDEGKLKSSNEEVIANWCVSTEEQDAVCAHLGAVEAPSEGAPSPSPESAEQAAGQGKPTPLVLQPALAALEAQQFAVCFDLAQAHCQHPDLAVQADAFRMCALALSRMNRWADAFDHYHHLFELEPSVLNALQLATTSLMAGELTRGNAWFDKASEINQASSDMPPARMRTVYISALEQAGEYEAAVPHLEWLAKGYMAMHITDDTFVWMRGFPFFSEYLSRSQNLLRHALPEADVKAWYVNMSASLDEGGQSQLAQHLARFSR